MNFCIGCLCHQHYPSSLDWWVGKGPTNRTINQTRPILKTRMKSQVLEESVTWWDRINLNSFRSFSLSPASAFVFCIWHFSSISCSKSKLTFFNCLREFSFDLRRNSHLVMLSRPFRIFKFEHLSKWSRLSAANRFEKFERLDEDSQEDRDNVFWLSSLSSSSPSSWWWWSPSSSSSSSSPSSSSSSPHSSSSSFFLYFCFLLSLVLVYRSKEWFEVEQSARSAIKQFEPNRARSTMHLPFAPVKCVCRLHSFILYSYR